MCIYIYTHRHSSLRRNTGCQVASKTVLDKAQPWETGGGSRQRNHHTSMDIAVITRDAYETEH